MKDIMMIITLVWLSIYIFIIADEDSNYNKRKFDKKVKTIQYVSDNIRHIIVEDKGMTFGITVTEEDLPKRFYSNPYSLAHININGEPVCRIHRLENLRTHRVIEYTKDRSKTEINNIIMKAYMIAKKEEKEYFDAMHHKEKSFYDN